MSEIERHTDALPGSAWDVWHAAGFQYAVDGGNCEGLHLDMAAGRYAAPKDGLRKDVIERAFKLGACQYLNAQKKQDAAQ